MFGRDGGVELVDGVWGLVKKADFNHRTRKPLTTCSPKEHQDQRQMAPFSSRIFTCYEPLPSEQESTILPHSQKILANIPNQGEPLPNRSGPQRLEIRNPQPPPSTSQPAKNNGEFLRSPYQAYPPKKTPPRLLHFPNPSPSIQQPPSPQFSPFPSPPSTLPLVSRPEDGVPITNQTSNSKLKSTTLWDLKRVRRSDGRAGGDGGSRIIPLRL